MKTIVTCGPSYEPIDEVRRLTNFSSGELGVCLSEALTEAGVDVLCLKGSSATYRDPVGACDTRHFNTNDDLLALLEELSRNQDVATVFHAAALCDYRVKSVHDGQGRRFMSPKIASRSGALTVSLEPATKVIGQMRQLFPNSLLVGWKYELAGSRPQAISKALQQIDECKTDACVLNGRAFGPGFAFYRSHFDPVECGDKSELIHFLVRWVSHRAVAAQ